MRAMSTAVERAAHPQTAQRQTVRRDVPRSGRRAGDLRGLRDRTGARSKAREHPIVVLPQRGRADFRALRARQSDARRDAPVHAPASPAVSTARLTRAGDDQRQHQRGADRRRERGGPRAARRASPTRSSRTIATSTCGRTIRWCATFEGEPRVLRRSRGYVPRTIDAGPRRCRSCSACGGELKNAFCLTKGSHAILSQHIGDLENYETQRFFEETLANLKKLFRVTPRVVAHDLHPLYLSTQLRAGTRGRARKSRCSIITRTSRVAWRRTGSTAT